MSGAIFGIDTALIRVLCSFWGVTFSKGTEKLVRVQDRAQKMSKGLESGTSGGKKLKWMWMIYLRQRKMKVDQISVF